MRNPDPSAWRGLRPPNDGKKLRPPPKPLPEPESRPVLLINRIPGNDLRELIEMLGERGVARQLNVHPKTVYRWLTGRVPIPGRQHLAIKMLLGDLPGTDGQWHGWKFVRGELCAPNGDSFKANEVLYISLLRQLANDQRRTIAELERRLQIAETALQHYTGAANDTRIRA